MKTPSHKFAFGFAAIVTVSALVYLMMGLASGSDDPKDFHLEEFGRLPIQERGRVKPIDTLARVGLMILSGKSEWVDAKEETQPAIRWLLDVMTAADRQRPTAGMPIAGDSRNVKAYRIEDPALRKMFKVDDKATTVFSFQELYDAAGSKVMQDFFAQVAELPPPDHSELMETDRPMSELAAQLRGHIQYARYETPHLIFRIDNDEVLAVLGLKARKGFLYGVDEFLPRLGFLEREARRAHKLPLKERSVFDQKAYDTFKHFELYVGLARGNAETLRLVAPPIKGMADFLPFMEAREALEDAMEKGRKREQMGEFSTTIGFDLMLRSYAAGNKDEFNKTIVSYQKLINETVPSETKTASMEASFNAFAPFYRGEVLYVMVLVVVAVYWLGRDPLLNRFAFGLLAFTFVVHTIALGMRMWIQGRPPVTNLYSSAVFIGWFCVLLCGIMEWKFRNALATFVGSLTGFATLLIAHYLGGSGDTLEMMQAVLDTNFWLATHVTTVTIGYSATFVAGVFGIFFLWQMLVNSVLNSLREGGPLSTGRAATFFISALSAAVLACTLAVCLLYGLWYRSGKNPTLRHVVSSMGMIMLVAGIGYAIYLYIQRRKLVNVEKPDGLPPGTMFLEQFAMTDQSRKVLTWMIYGTVCFAMLFSFVGTVLGGIWADQSWGRFWGWDPKENGAILIVIMNALILHARWGGMIQERGMATLALVGNMITMWSWFGTNQLGIGLHAYGFNNALVLLCRWFWVSQLVLIGLALMPLPNWRTYTPLADMPATTPVRKQGR